MIGLGHECQAPAVEIGDLLGAMLEDHAPVGRFEDMVVADVDLVLAVGGLALAELDRHPRLGHLVAQQAVERLGLGGLEQVVVLVVVAERPRHAPARFGELLPGVLEDVELELAAGLDREPRRCGAIHLALQDRPRRDRDLLVGRLVDRVRQDEGGLLEPRHVAQRIPDRRCDPVAVAGLPVHEPEAFRRVHLHVRAEQVGAEMGAVIDDAVQERLALDALAHEAALHVGDGDDDRVDPAVADGILELGETRVLVVLVAHGLSPARWLPRAGRVARPARAVVVSRGSRPRPTRTRARSPTTLPHCPGGRARGIASGPRPRSTRPARR